MKKTIKSSILVIGVSALALFFGSCGSTSQNKFAKAKYYNFGHNHPVVAFNRTNHPSSNVDKVTLVAKSEQVAAATNTEVTINSSNVQSTNQTIVAQRKTRKSIAQKPVIASVSKKVESNTVSQSKSIADVSPDEIQSANNVQGGGTVPLILLVILAIFIPPLAVYLHDDALKTHFWIILILWLLAGGLAFGVAGTFGLLWLVAVIWALLIVLNSAGSV